MQAAAPLLVFVLVVKTVAVLLTVAVFVVGTCGIVEVVSLRLIVVVL